MLYFLLILFALLIPFSFKVQASTEKNGIILRASFILFFEINFLKKSITAKKILSFLFSKKKSKNQNKSRTFNSIRQHITIKKLHIKSIIGTGDASSTAIISGQAFGLVAPFAASVTEKDGCFVDITPCFDKKELFFDGECIISTNIANTIVAILEILGGKIIGKASY